MLFARLSPRKQGLIFCCAAATLLVALEGNSLVRHVSLAAAQRDEDASKKSQSAEQEVVIKREALKLTDPKAYRVSMQLQAARTVALTAPVDGWVRTVAAKPQQKLNQQGEVLRLDDRRSELLLKRARAGLQAAQLEKKIAQSKGDADQVSLAEVRLEVAQADVELAQMELDRLIIRAPFNGEIERITAVEGQFVRAGERLATLVDPAKLVVEVPAERAAALPGGTLEIKVEEIAVKAKVDSVLSLGKPFDALRELTTSPVSALVSVDNATGSFSVGQTVYSELIPTAPVAIVPTAAISNVPDGNRKLQVLRDYVVRDLSVRILGKVGTDSVFVSGRFSEGDEVIVSSTRALADGTPLRALVAGASRGPGTRNDSGTTSGGAKKPGVGF